MEPSAAVKPLPDATCSHRERGGSTFSPAENVSGYTLRAVGDAPWSARRGAFEHHPRCHRCGHEHRAPGREADDRPTLRNLHSLDELAPAVDDIVDRTAGDRPRGDGPDPEIAVGVGANRAGEEGRLVIRQLIRSDENDVRTARMRRNFTWRTRGASSC